MGFPDAGPPAPAVFRDALRAGEQAPSVHNTRPWVFSGGDGSITVSGDVDRGLHVADPGARELVISCGAALYNIRVALRAAGTVPEVTELPDPDRPALLAEVTAAGTAEPSDAELSLYAAIDERRTHRGPFESSLDDTRILADLRAAAAAESAGLRLITDDLLIRSLAGLVNASEYLHRRELDHAEELHHWVRVPGSRLPGGVAADDIPAEESAGEPLFAGRDFGADVQGRREASGTATGTVAILETPADTRSDRLAAGQALERVLLAATANGASAAFHTQPLEEPRLRSFIAEHFCEGAHPQMIMRVGYA
ncbi:Acg family FMN-binding oxidoreductase [Nocardiopsis sediminis]|uniref:Acg family FMN-binding oxidoreductase n=1 Tax=Nocardiopsis sediminis TaxID=1778267 RepID=A0ABV8FXC6_9ACTN